MRAILYVLAAFGVIGLAIWAYQQSQATQEARAEARQLRAEIRSLTEELSVQRAEWAFLNRPQRLRELVELNFARLGLLPMEGSQFGQIAEIPYPMLIAAPEATP
jgi:hypothetical protein